MRIVQLTPSLSVGGAERMVYRLAEEFSKRGHQVEVCVMSPDLGTELDQKTQAVVPVHYINRTSPELMGVTRRLNAYLSKVRPHVIHSHLAALSDCVLTPAYWQIPARVHTVHNMAEREVSPKRRALHSFMMKRVAPVSIADAVQQSLRAKYGDRDFPLIPVGILIDNFKRRPVDRSAVLGIPVPDDAVVFATVARLAPQKNLTLLIEAFKKVHERAPNARLAIAGDGPDREKLDAKVAELNLQGLALILGVRSDIPDILSAADVFAMSSDFEGSPAAIMEAMAASLPAVSTAVGGIPEIIREGETGFLAPAGDGHALAAAMLKVMDPKVRAEFSIRAEAIARKEYDFAVMASRYEDLYRRLLQNRR